MIELNPYSQFAVGLVGWWPLGVATDGRDLSIRGNHGTLTNGPTASATGNRRALKFDGTNDYFTAPRPAQITSSSPVTVSMWAKLDQTPALVNLFNLSDGINTILLGYWWTGNGFILRNGTTVSATTLLSSNPDITLWHHWAFMRTGDGTGTKIYVDGNDLTGGASGSLSDVDVNAFELSRGLSGGYQAQMTVDDVRIYNRALTGNEIYRLYDETRDGGYGSIVLPRRRRRYTEAVAAANRRRRFLIGASA